MSEGTFGGPCNRTMCQAPGATHFNQSTRAYYCEECANTLNTINADDAQRLFASPLCVPVGHEKHPLAAAVVPVEESEATKPEECRAHPVPGRGHTSSDHDTFRNGGVEACIWCGTPKSEWKTVPAARSGPTGEREPAPRRHEEWVRERVAEGVPREVAEAWVDTTEALFAHYDDQGPEASDAATVWAAYLIALAENRAFSSRLRSLEEERETNEAIFRWLLGEEGEFPESLPGRRYNFRSELRGRLAARSVQGGDK